MADRTSTATAAVAMTLFVLLTAGGATVAGDAERVEQPSIVVTTEVLGGIVTELVAGAAEVSILMEGGADPHSWQPSARDTERVFEADLVVANGLMLEEGLVAVLDEAGAQGVPVFEATDHVEVRVGGEAGGEAQDHADHEDGDPHFWLDPLAMHDVVVALSPVLVEAGIDIGERGSMLASDLEALDAEVREILSAVPEERRQLVTGHGALGYLADRYGFEVIGAVVPGITTSGEPSARQLAELIDTIREADVAAIFTDIGTPQSLAEAIAQDSGAEVVELDIARLRDGGSYADLVRDVASAIAGALSAT